MFQKYRCTLVVSHSKVKWYAQEIGQLLPKKEVVYWHNKYLTIYNKLTIISLGQYKSEDLLISNKTFIETKMSMLPMYTGSVQKRQKNSPKVT